MAFFGMFFTAAKVCSLSLVLIDITAEAEFAHVKKAPHISGRGLLSKIILSDKSADLSGEVPRNIKASSNPSIKVITDRVMSNDLASVHF